MPYLQSLYSNNPLKACEFQQHLKVAMQAISCSLEYDYSSFECMLYFITEL